MKYVQPLGAAEDSSYVNPNPLAGIQGSPVPAEALEHPQREIMHVIQEAGLIPDPEDLTQLYQAIVGLLPDLPATAGAFAEKCFIVEEQQASGVNGQTMGNVAAHKRILNTVVHNGIAGASVLDSQITLPVGNFFALFFTTIKSGTGKARSFLRNMTANAELFGGLVASSDGSGASSNFLHCGAGRFTLGVSSVIELQSRCESSSSHGGQASGFGIEKYSSVLIWKVG